MPDDGRPTSHCLLDLAPPDIAWFQERSDLILIPIGSCEQHGALHGLAERGRERLLHSRSSASTASASFCLVWTTSVEMPAARHASSRSAIRSGAIRRPYSGCASV